MELSLGWPDVLHRRMLSDVLHLRTSFTVGRSDLPGCSWRSDAVSDGQRCSTKSASECAAYTVGENT